MNDAPTAVNDTAMTAEDTRVNIDVLDNDTDPDTERARLRVSVLTQPLNGTARAQSDQTITYTPDANFAGPNSFTYRVSDGQFTDDGSVSVTVVAVNDAPTAVNDTAMTAEDTRVNIDVLDNDTDPDTERARLRVSVLTQPLNGTARAQSDQTITYTPDANFAGPNSFTYRVSDGQFTDDGSVSVTVVAVNDAPTAVNDTAMTAEDTRVNIDVLDNDTDPDTERARLRVSVLTQPLNGTARVESDRTITYTPNANFAGENSFTYSVSDGSLSDAGLSHGHRRSGERRPGIPGGDGRALGLGERAAGRQRGHAGDSSGH